MTALWTVFAVILRDQRSALLRGAALSLVVLVMGVALLGLSGWFITAAAAAGLAGAGAVFDVFRPSAMVRFLALGRAAARYGERVLTHDATLRALESLRLRVLAAHLAAPHGAMIRIRGAQALNRLTADIDALDGVPLRLVLPLIAGALAQILALAALWLLVAPGVALWVVGGYVLGAALIFGRMAVVAVPLSRRAETAAQAFRSRLIDLIRARRDLAVYGQLAAQAGAAMEAEARRFALRRRLDRAERWTGAALAALASLVAAGALGIGMTLVQAGLFEPAFAALGFFAALALAETLMPLRRAAADLGRMADAARRVARDLAPQAAPPAGEVPQGTSLCVADATLHRPGSRLPVLSGLSLTVAAGETVAITGASGSGKSTLLLAVAGLHPLAAGQISLGGLAVADWPEASLRGVLTLLPQRSTLMEGTVAEALRLAIDAGDAQLWQVLAAVQLDGVIHAKGGLSARIGPRGEGVSGGEARRLALARALLRRPQVLLLDEPTEGLDDATAALVLRGIRAELPGAAIVIAAHRQVETAAADRVLELR
ncbi:ATP-binding cassette domain-containing protein [Frigidibacter albus]|uniref:ATP-binding cassette domain-containing protein n=1 Tax=Frigidibacter albus TaxID=1465486 RepID=A0A6L8VK95_9RHOB|nr:ATP-binding cassette domain-containing protein [Frigidibacter albus]MZQ90623.1 ATP-binding cassette domain-containing protein [Frigidibacter albus]NBE32721.1 ATP-binding cassette domain-containing protein [Frigidibacter albus]GGH60575.1 ABC transporter permease [Frigidibacter albus]